MEIKKRSCAGTCRAVRYQREKALPVWQRLSFALSYAGHRVEPPSAACPGTAGRKLRPPRRTLCRTMPLPALPGSSTPKDRSPLPTTGNETGRPLCANALRTNILPAHLLLPMLCLVVEQTVQSVEVGLRGRDDDIAIGAAARVNLPIGRGNADGDLAKSVDAARDGLHRELREVIVNLRSCSRPCTRHRRDRCRSRCPVTT